MKSRTKISWADFTINPWEGCTKVSAGCKFCYAENRNQRYAAGANWGPGAPRRKGIHAIAEIATLNALAVADGFSCWEEMRDWFLATHGLPFTGQLIHWR
jgi:protein gp37